MDRSTSKHEVAQSLTGTRKPRLTAEERFAPDELRTGAVRKLVGANPPVGKHNPATSYVTDVDGNPVAIAEMRTVGLDYSSTRNDAKQECKILAAPSLWRGYDTHERVTHALRVLQHSTCSKAMNSEVRRALTDRPENILMQAGLNRADAGVLVARLSELQLVESRFVQTSGTRWTVRTDSNTVTARGELQKLNLLERAPTNGTVSVEVPGESENAEADREEEAEVKATGSKQETLLAETTQALQAIKQEALAQGATANDRNFLEFKPGGSLIGLLVGLFGWSRNVAASRLRVLTAAGLVIAPRGSSMTNHVSAEAETVTEADLRRAAAAPKAPYRRKNRQTTSRYIYLEPAYQLILREMPEGLEPDAKGYVEFITDYSYRELLQREIPGLAGNEHLRTAQRVLNDLGVLNVVITTNAPTWAPGSMKRRVKLGKSFGESDFKLLKRRNRKKKSEAKPGKRSRKPAEAVATPVTAGENIEQILTKLGERLDGYKAQVTGLESQVQDLTDRVEQRDKMIAQLQAELETASAQASAPIVVPPELLEQLQEHLKD